jgi:hypothetical protein
MKLKAQPAMLVLSSMIVIGGLALLIVLLVVLSSVDLLQQGTYDNEFNETFIGSDACAEEALLKLNSNSSYTGENFTIDSVQCTVSVSGTGSTRTLTVSATQGSVYVSDLELTIDVSTSPISISNWEQTP